ncbi:pentatricopeptide repeat-containing protein At2g37320 [Rhodamnia argentea]|uniref:Pentatricopeptide repeat-containing protein At2g37320 n=1 Tax=Rhodamnia argentea TaxID=178133 RepID=A0A8B8Q630_9MYRT|nr:pentatricopeptide repeat-containing protein At2g37320 [Rhodamnia argentea]
MNNVLRKKTACRKIDHHLTSTRFQFRPFSSRKLTHHHPLRSKRLDKALRIVSLVAPKTSGNFSRQNHLRLIEDFLDTNSNARKLANGFNSLGSSSAAVRSVFEEMLESAVSNKKGSVFGECSSKEERVGDSAVGLSHALSSCGSARDLEGGVQFHCLAMRTGFLANVYVGSSLITLYGRCGELGNAHRVFEEMSVKNVVSWTAIIAGFAQEWQVDECLELYHSMRYSASKPNDFTFTSLLSACTGSGALGQGKSAHCQAIQMGFALYIHVANSLISMYCKCGCMDDALLVFHELPKRDLVSWNSMIAGYAQYGLAHEAIDLFQEMMLQKVKPDAITFLGVLSSCRHAGLVKQGQLYFDSMVDHGLIPDLDHYACVVDLLGRSGKLEEARNFIKRMPVQPNAVIWGSLLSSCRLHGSIWFGIQAAESRLVQEPGCAATYVQLSNLYASIGLWDQAARVRKLMKDKCLKTCPGYSWIEISNAVHRFRAEDWCNGRVTQILGVLDCLMDHMRNHGYVPEVHEEEELSCAAL